MKDGFNAGSILPQNHISDPTLQKQVVAAYLTAFKSIFLVVFPMSILAGLFYAFVQVKVGAKELRRQSQEKNDTIIVLDLL